MAAAPALGTRPGSRLLKVQCGYCAYTCRITRKWLDELGPPLCPCNSQPMEMPPELEDAAAVAMPTYRVLREKEVQIRSIQFCADCREEYAHGEHMRYRVVATSEGELLRTYHCWNCDSGNIRTANRRALARC